MKTSLIVTVFVSATALAVSSFGQTSPAPGGKTSNSGTVPVPANPATAQPNAADMEKMMQQMMAQATQSKKSGGNNNKYDSGFIGDTATGAVTARATSKAMILRERMG